MLCGLQLEKHSVHKLKLSTCTDHINVHIPFVPEEVGVIAYLLQLHDDVVETPSTLFVIRSIRIGRHQSSVLSYLLIHNMLISEINTER